MSAQRGAAECGHARSPTPPPHSATLANNPLEQFPAMRLKKVTLNNFRCFQNLEVELHPRLNVLVGENGAGKTAVLDGIAAGLSRVVRYLSSANQRLTAKGVGIKDTDFRIELWESRGGKERWGTSDYAQVIAETTPGMQWDYSLGREETIPEFQWDYSRGKAPNTIGESALASYIGKVLESFKTAEPKLLPVFAYYGAQRGRIEIPERLRSSKENYGHPTSALVDALDSLSNFKEMLKWFDIEEANELRANKGRTSKYYEESPALAAVRVAIESLLDFSYRTPYFNKDHKFILESSKGGMPLQVSQLSQGYQSMLALGMDFARRLALANSHFGTGSTYLTDALIEEVRNHGWSVSEADLLVAPMFAPAIMLVDEIDLHLHPSWQQRVLDDLMRTFPMTQFIVTTHSPQVLTTVPAECIRVLHNEINPDTGQLESWLEIPEQQTRGVSSADALASAMAVDPVPNVPEAAWLRQYRALIQQGLQDGAEGLALKEKLLAHFGEQHPEMLDCERMIRLEAFKRKLPPLGKNSSAEQ